MNMNARLILNLITILKIEFRACRNLDLRRNVVEETYNNYLEIFFVPKNQELIFQFIFYNN